MSDLRFTPGSLSVGGSGDAPDADATTKGLVKLAGDLGGTADAPTVPGLADKADAAATTTALAGKAATSHTHPQSDVTGLTAALAAKADDAATTTALAAKAPLASPTFTGDPKAPTPAQGDNDTSVATTAYVQTEAGLLIPKSLVDAKGDLLVGSADNTVIRKAVGSDGQVLTADAASTGGLKWSTPASGGKGLQVYPESGKAFFPSRIRVQSSMTPVDNSLYCVPIELGRALTLSALEVQVATAGGASSVARLGIYADDGTLYPGALLLDGGTVATASTGRKTLSGLSLAMPAGAVYWLAVAVQANGGTIPVFTASAFAGTEGQLFGSTVTSGGDYFNGQVGTQVLGFRQASVSGALPASFTTTRTLVSQSIAICGVA